MDPKFINFYVLILLSLMTVGHATTSNSSQAALEARARLSVFRYQSIVRLRDLFYNFDYETYDLEWEKICKQESELEEEIKKLDPEVNISY